MAGTLKRFRPFWVWSLTIWLEERETWAAIVRGLREGTLRDDTASRFLGRRLTVLTGARAERLRKLVEVVTSVKDVILILKINSRIGSLQLESLILAQNERWRQA